jgi:predicted Na+-dependent transporter
LVVESKEDRTVKIPVRYLSGVLGNFGLVYFLLSVGSEAAASCKVVVGSEAFLRLLLAVRGSYWFQEWSQLSKEEERMTVICGCKKLEMMVLEFFTSAVWRQHKSLEH